MTTIVLVTRNLGKLDEIRTLIPVGYNLKTLSDVGFWEDIEETGSTFTENSLLKARTVFNRLHLNTLADDSGLEVEALLGEPGVNSARYAGKKSSDEENIRKLLLRMEGISNRKACFRTVVTLILSGKEYLFEGSVRGSVAFRPRGEHGFGYDPVFIPSGFDQTFAEMTAGLKNQISHRGEALQKMSVFLKTAG